MIKLKDILREGRTLSVFDFDDTLAKTDAWIYVKGPKGEKQLEIINNLAKSVEVDQDGKEIEVTE